MLWNNINMQFVCFILSRSVKKFRRLKNKIKLRMLESQNLTLFLIFASWNHENKTPRIVSGKLQKCTLLQTCSTSPTQARFCDFFDDPVLSFQYYLLCFVPITLLSNYNKVRYSCSEQNRRHHGPCGSNSHNVTQFL